MDVLLIKIQKILEDFLSLNDLDCYKWINAINDLRELIKHYEIENQLHVDDIVILLRVGKIQFGKGYDNNLIEILDRFGKFRIIKDIRPRLIFRRFKNG